MHWQAVVRCSGGLFGRRVPESRGTGGAVGDSGCRWVG